jgi:RHS repeat-associated protein
MQVLSSRPHYSLLKRPIKDDLFTYEYDENENLIKKVEKATGRTTTYSYDAENQLIRVDLPAGTYAAYKYDGLGRRIEKNVNGKITRYVYDNEDILCEYNYDPSAMSYELTATYIHGPGIDEPISMTREGQTYFYHADGLGSIRQLSDSTGTSVQSYSYDSFGNITDQTGSITNSYTYTGREYDPESGLYYYRARYYDPSIGRFLQEDPVSNILIIPQALNLYPYTRNNPINYIDTYGLQADQNVRDESNATRYPWKGQWLDFESEQARNAFLASQTGYAELARAIQESWDPEALAKWCETWATPENVVMALEMLAISRRIPVFSFNPDEMKKAAQRLIPPKIDFERVWPNDFITEDSDEQEPSW